MKHVAISIMVIGAGYLATAQDDIGACMTNVYIKADSVEKAGKSISEEWRNCAVGKKLPAFNLATLSGDTINSTQFEGKIVVINFWFIGCHPCIAEIPGMNKLVAEYKNSNVEFLAITYETIKMLNEFFLPKYHLDFNIIPDAKKYITKAIGSGYPTTFIADAKGIIKEVWSGGSIDDKAGDQYYEKAKPIIDMLLRAQ